jgi:hypothetical protein
VANEQRLAGAGAAGVVFDCYYSVVVVVVAKVQLVRIGSDIFSTIQIRQEYLHCL